MDFYCKHCGQQENDLGRLVRNSCSDSPTQRHEAFEGDASRNEFLCKHCGQQENDLGRLVRNYCSNSPTKKHVAFEGKS